MINAKDIEYEKRKNYEFTKEPKNLKFQSNITITNTFYGWNDMFEIFISYQDNKEYLVSPNSNNYNLDIYSLIDNQKIKSVKGHNDKIRTVRYFINNKNKNEYLISGGDGKIVIIWDINDNYNIKCTIDTKYEKHILSCLLIFPENIDDIYIITSSYNTSENYENSATKFYLMNNGKFLKYINNTNDIPIYYLLPWYNRNEHKYYIIQLCKNKILINNLFEEELYYQLIKEPESYHFSGFIYNKDNKDYLCSSSSNGYINIWDLYNKKLIKIINTRGCELTHIIKWNSKYFIAANRKKKSFQIINIENNSIIDIKSNHTGELISIKKIVLPIYGEALLSAGRDKKIKLWIVE